MRCFLLIAFFALMIVLVAAKAGPQHGQHGGVKHEGPQQGGSKPGLPLNGTLPALNGTTPTTANETTTEGSTTEGTTTTVAAST
ncbi:uncharacterized protein LOC110178083 [Drosophila serrata]|uniref:uncharacterized protein LOC110178083 n=1 Tax=Drosophila serrata TaxID=7274 RepID=UPI000A1D140F|nr:uncharacterized protein LOC110178083 [Drosophila serrata]